MPTIYISGVHSGPNPSPGLGVARCLREAYPDARLVAVDYSARSTGIHSDIFDDVRIDRPWQELHLPTHFTEIRRLLESGALWIPTLDPEVRWLAGETPGERALHPPSNAIALTAKPAVEAARRLPVSAPESISALRPDSDLHAFCRRHGWRVWLKGPSYEAHAIRDWPSFCRTRQELSEKWRTDDLLLQAHVHGTEESVAFAAYRGRLLGAVRMEKRLKTEQGKTWAGRIEDVPGTFLGPLENLLAGIEWTGGGEIELVRNGAGLHLIDWNPRFPAWIYGAAIAGRNLPGALVAAACGDATVAPSRVVAREFARVVLEVPVRATHPLPPALLPDESFPSIGKYVTGYPTPAPGTRTATQALRAAPAIDEAVLKALGRIRVNELKTPARVFFPEVLKKRLERPKRLMADTERATPRIFFAYSVKTNPDPRIVRAVGGAGLLAEVISPEEARHARRLGFPPDRVIVNGPLAGRVTVPGREPLAAWFADSLSAFKTRLTTGGSAATYLGVRLRPPGIVSRFGVDVSDPKTFENLIGLLNQLPAAQKLALHLHVPSDSAGVLKWWELWESLLVWAETIERTTGRPMSCLDVGGGWSPADFEREFLPRLSEMAASAMQRLPRLEVLVAEPGKALVQPATVLVTTVVEVRRRGGSAAEAVVDASVSALPLARDYPHRILARDGRRWQTLPAGQARILGSACMEHDVLAPDVSLPPRLRAGDRLVFCDAGAYDASMAYRFGRG